MTQQNEQTFTDEELKRFREMEAEVKRLRAAEKQQQKEAEELRQATETAEAEKAALRQMAETAQKQAREAAEAVTAMQRAERLRTFAETAQGFSGDTQKHVSIMDALSDELREEYVTHQRAMAEQLRASSVFTKFGVHGRDADNGSAGAQLQAFAEQAVTKATEAGKSLTMAQAYAEVLADPKNRDLYERYTAEQTA